MSTGILLASSSASRRDLLESAGVEFETRPPRVDEEGARHSLAADGVSPRDQADALAELKAGKISKQNPDAWVIGCDQILDFRGSVLAKPDSPDDLVNQLTQLSGGRHSLYSAVVVFQNGQPQWRHIGEAHLTMHVLSKPFITSYVARNWEDVRHCVGGYQVEAVGVRLFSRVEGDYHSILGLPLVPLLSYLTLRGVLEI